MPITLNGNGTITGVAVGGLPDGIVDTDMLAANAVSSAKLASGVGGKLLQHVVGTASSQVERTSAGYADTGLSASITTTSSNKVLIFVAQALEARQYNSTGFSQGALKLVRITSGVYTNVFEGSNKSIVASGEGSGSWFVASGCIASIVAEDSPGAGTHTYTTQLNVSARSGTAIRANSEGHPAEIILMEVAA